MSPIRIPPDALLLTGKNSDFLGIEGRLNYVARVKAVMEGGEMSVDYRTLYVEGADVVTLFIAAATNFVDYKNVSGDPAGRVDQHLSTATLRPYEQLKADHLADHRRLFRRVALDLGQSEAINLPTDERIRLYEPDRDPQLAALYYQFGRYLLICSSRSGTEPANLQGIWNQDSNPWWDSKYTININIPMNYWPIEVGNLRENFEPLVQLVKDVSEAGRVVARKHWGARGWVLHQNTDLWRATAPMDGPSWGAWPVGGAWLCTQLWQHYLFEEDLSYLRDIYPVLRGSVLFLLDVLVEHPRYGWLVTAPSNSPENFPAWEGNGRFFDEVTGAFLKARTMTVGPTMDMQIIRALFGAFVEAADILEEDSNLRDEVAVKIDRLAPNQIGKHGQLQEWIEDWDEIEPDHRHVSHLWGLFPGDEITPEATPDYADAARVSLQRRGIGGCGWSMGWSVGLFARLGDGNQSLVHLKSLLRDRSLPNLFSLCGRALQVDGNLGATAGIAEMLIQSHGDVLRLVPALPDAWPDGSVQGFRARGGFEVAMDWENGRIISATIQSLSGNRCRIRTDERLVVSSEGKTIRTSMDGNVLSFDTIAGSTYLTTPVQ